MDTPDKSPEALLDPEQIRMLLESGADDSLDLFNEILVLFEEESRSKLEEMKATRDAGDFEAFSRAAHALAGSSANIGGKVVWLMARDMENLCRGGQPEKAIAMLPELEELHKETLIQMRHFVDQSRSPQS